MNIRTDELIRRLLFILAEDCVPDGETAERLRARIFGHKEDSCDEQA